MADKSKEIIEAEKKLAEEQSAALRDLRTKIEWTLPIDGGCHALEIDKDIPRDRRVELVVIDAVQGFTRKGQLADPQSMKPMVAAIDDLAVRLLKKFGGRFHATLFADWHSPDILEPPYPRHCLRDTEEVLIDPDLAWLATLPQSALFRKDCVNGLIGSFRSNSGDADSIYYNGFLQHMRSTRPKAVIVTGCCTDICVSDFTTAILSARNHGLLCPAARASEAAHAEAVKDFAVYVYEPGCATYDALGHPGVLAHYIGLWTMASRGATIVSEML